MPSSYTLGSHFEALVQQLIGSGRYVSASEVVRDGLRLLEERERLREIKESELRRLIDAGRSDQRPSTNADGVFDRLEAKYQAMVAERKGV